MMGKFLELRNIAPFLLLISVVFIIRCIVCIWQRFNYWNNFNVTQSNESAIRTFWRNCTNWRLSYHMMRCYKICRHRRNTHLTNEMTAGSCDKWSHMGSFLFTRPILFVACPKLIKEIACTNQRNFCNRGSYHNDESMADLNLFNMKDDAWCRWRKIISNSLAPVKMRHYMTVIKAAMEKNLQELKQIHDLPTRSKTTEVQSIDFFKFANSFAITISEYFFLGTDVTNERSRVNCEILSAIFQPTLWNKLSDILSYPYPGVLKFFNVSEFPRKTHEHVKLILKNALQENLKKQKTDTKFANLNDGSIFNQLVDLMMIDDSLEEDTIIGILSALFLGGLKSTTPFLTYACYELARAPQIQEKLREEIRNTLGELTHENLKNNMTYMTCFLNEVMRHHNGGPLIIRECNKTCKIQSIDLIVEEGILVIASLRGILMDPEYFENPEEFDPDRFLSHDKFPKEAFRPFGIGRHMCIGNAFAVFQAKVFLVLLLSQYYIGLDDKTTFCDKQTRLSTNSIYLTVSPILSA